ncbi:MAG: radical SAM family heme chaperone HemW [Nitrospirota bacterium]|jgi:oxygen-independent coproporphyrinogen-3 oxidase
MIALDAPTQGLYIHIPFCRSRCTYCDFNVVTLREAGSRVTDYFEALKLQLARLAPPRATLPLHSIYIGGGTPSAVPAGHIIDLLAEVGRHFTVAQGCEITVEVNPGSGDEPFLRALHGSGVNRISVGVQSFADADLRGLGRGHTAADAKRLLALCRHLGFTNVSLDLILGLPGQTVSALEAGLAQAVATEVPHLSAYLLHLEDHVPMASQVRRDERCLPTDGSVADMFRLLHDRLAAAGLGCYEISNFSRRGFESRHNRGYWRCEPCVALGLGGHGMRIVDGGWQREMNEVNLARFLAAIAAGGDGIVAREQLPERGLLAEWAMLRLRLREGIERAELHRCFGLDAADWLDQRLVPYGARGWLEVDAIGWRLTLEGRLFSDTVFCELFD